MFTEVAKRLEISEDELQSYFELPPSGIKYKNNAWAFKLGVWLYTKLGIIKRIGK